MHGRRQFVIQILLYKAIIKLYLMNFRRWNYNCAFLLILLLSDNGESL
jgi:hypothetical protein